MAKVLIIEDDDVIARGMARHLEAAGFDAVGVANGETGLAKLRYEKPDVCVLDLMLPGIDGWRVIEQARSEGIGTPIVVVSARGTEHDRVHALEIGADDYLVKPFAFDELCARIQALVRRRHQSKNPVIQLGSLELDTARRQVSRRGDPLHLTPSEYALLEFLAYQRGRVFSQEQLIEHLRRSDSDVASNVVEVLVSGLRKKIHVNGEPPILRTRRGFGYFVQ